MKDCIFCQIISGNLPSSIVYKDKLCTAILDIKPINPGHLLIIPNNHATYLVDMEENIFSHISAVGMKLAKAIRVSNIKCEGIDFFLADGEAAGQEVFHVHLHIIPRYKGDGFGFKFGPNYGKLPDREALDRIAKDIKSQLN